MADRTITGIVTWLKGWFYDKEDIIAKENVLQTQINNKASQSDFNTLSSTVNGKLDASAYVVDSALSSSSENPVQNKVINTALSGKASSSHTHYTDDVEVPQQLPNIGTSQWESQTEVNGAIDTILGTINTSLSGKASSSHTHSSADVTEASALSNIGTSANASQHTINESIDNIIGNLTGADIIKVVTTLPTASASTMNALYLLSSNGQYDIYITTESSGSYSWEKLDDDVLSDLSIDWSDIENKPSTFTPSNHTHGYIENDGTISNSPVATFSILNYPIVRDNSDGKLKVGLTPTNNVRDSRAYSNIGSSSGATQYVINGSINTAIGNLLDSVDGKRNIQRAYSSDADDSVEEGHYYTLGGIVNTGQNQGMSFLDVMVDDYDRIVQVCYEYDYGEALDNDVHQYIRYSTNNGSTWSAWKRFVESNEVVSKADKSSVIDWDTLTFVPKATDETGAITFDYLE